MVVFFFPGEQNPQLSGISLVAVVFLVLNVPVLKVEVERSMRMFPQGKHPMKKYWEVQVV